MLGHAAQALGHTCRFLDPAENPPAALVGETIRADYDDSAALCELAAASDVVTYEFENVPVDALQTLAPRTVLYPPPDALRLAQDRLSEKQLFEKLGIPVPPYQIVDSREDLVATIATLGFPAVLKTRRYGYDGKGQFVIRDGGDLDSAWTLLGGRPLIAEAWVPFEREVSIIGARARDGSTRTWPLTENRHTDGILRVSLAPVDDAALERVAVRYMHLLLDQLDYVGVLTLELFVSGNGLLANEFAPRVHNSGHWTIEGAATSQFENHVRAVCGAPLGSTRCRDFVGMVNLIGLIPAAIRALPDPRTTLHDYGKTARAGRKLGHVTVVAPTAAERDRLVADLDHIVNQTEDLQGLLP
jgi:5-(carboxyamino)imidazole ribonucleotide synthase